jgi:hypothetical protein
MYTIFSAVLRQQREHDVMKYLGHSTRSAVYYKAVSPFSYGKVYANKGELVFG